MNIWIHRITQFTDVAYPLLEKGYLSIGFSEFSDPVFINDVCRVNDRRIFEKYVVDNLASLPPACEDLWRFVVEMRKGNKVIVPDTASYSVYELSEDLPKAITELDLSGCKDKNGHPLHTKVDGGLYTHTGEFIDIGFVRGVTLVQKKHISLRRCFSQASIFSEYARSYCECFLLSQAITRVLGSNETVRVRDLKYCPV